MLDLKNYIKRLRKVLLERYILLTKAGYVLVPTK